MKPTILSIAFALVSLTVYAQPPQGGPHHGPPPEAVAACANQEADTLCAFESPAGETIEGVCRTPPPDAPADAPALACVPNGHRPPPPGDRALSPR